MTHLPVDRHLAGLSAMGDRLRRAAEVAGPDAAVPSCPGWTVRDLVAHTGGVHRWATTVVAGARPGPPDAATEAACFAAVADADLLGWFDTGLHALVDALASAPDDLSCWAFLPAPAPKAFWARRQAHETAVHAADAELAAGTGEPVPADLAADGIDELLRGFLGRRRHPLVADPPVTLAVDCADTGDGWTLTVGPDARSVVDGVGPADCVVSGPASALYLLLWNRLGASPPVTVTGDAGVLGLWRERAVVSWA